MKKFLDKIEYREKVEPHGQKVAGWWMSREWWGKLCYGKDNKTLILVKNLHHYKHNEVEEMKQKFIERGICKEEGGKNEKVLGASGG